MRHIGGGYKRNYREMEYVKGPHSQEISGRIESIEHDPNRTGYIAGCVSGSRRVYKLVGGNSLPKIGDMLEVIRLGESPIGGSVYSVSLKAGTCGKLARARGAGCKIVKQEEKTTVIRLPSGEIKRLNRENTCVEGEVYGRAPERLGTAGAHRRLGVRPSVRGIAMNSCDHPNGGKTHSSKIKNK